MSPAIADLPPRPRTKALPFDHTLRYFVPSRREPNKPPYLVELDAYNGNGMCICKHFTIRCEKFLKRAITPEAAVRGVEIDGELCRIKLKENRGVEDALRCEHILTARSQFCDDVIKAIHELNESKANPQNH